MVSKGLDEVGFSSAGRSEQKHITGFPDEAARRQVVELFPLDRCVEVPVEILQGFGIPECGGLCAPFDAPVGAQFQFILQHEFEELGVIEAVRLLPVAFSSPSHITDQ